MKNKGKSCLNCKYHNSNLNNKPCYQCDITLKDNKYEPSKWQPVENEICDFCFHHEAGDDLYEMSGWDGGIGFDYIRNIQYCPMCGKKLRDPKEK